MKLGISSEKVGYLVNKIMRRAAQTNRKNLDWRAKCYKEKMVFRQLASSPMISKFQIFRFTKFRELIMDVPIDMVQYPPPSLASNLIQMRNLTHNYITLQLLYSYGTIVLLVSV